MPKFLVETLAWAMALSAVTFVAALVAGVF